MDPSCGDLFDRCGQYSRWDVQAAIHMDSYEWCLRNSLCAVFFRKCKCMSRFLT